MDAAVLVPLDAPGAVPPDVQLPREATAAPAAQSAREPAAATCEVASALALALREAQEWLPQTLTVALASLGDINLPPLATPTVNASVLAVLPTLYFVHGLDEAGVLKAAETVAGLWASGAIQVVLPDHGQALQQYWRTRRERLTPAERQHLLGLVFDARDFDPALAKLCQALVALADNAGQHDLHEEVGLQHAAGTVLDLCAVRLEGAPLAAAADLLAQTRAAVAVLSPRVLQTAFAVRDFWGLVELSERASGADGTRARQLAERAQAGAAVLRWLALAAAQGFAIDPRAASLPGLLANAQRWLLDTTDIAASAPSANDQRRVAAA